MAVIPGTYQLLVRRRRAVSIRVGGLGLSRLPAGWYVYTGSARNGLVQRVRRHLRREKRMHWHIDYLLMVADGVEAFVLPGTAVAECELHAGLAGGKVAVPGFGSLGCRCRSHLAWFRKRPRVGLTGWPECLRRPAIFG
ncbi:MAG TPA: GIY-YIG nuclease family protein [Phycisphaerae bacterium]|nr:GIY-YIG nuclease family protein [Phycisphaerae bacterium]HRY70311.1 GIY-YIG nuclease family protein [Phycisphaerae bacterium]HSA28028.1 GIY-YIG nuclease family protein [Phycisphaerae bacterium]